MRHLARGRFRSPWPRPTARPLFAGLFLTAATFRIASAQPALPLVEGSPGFNPHQYVGPGDAYDCAHFTSQAEGQAVLRADPTDANRLDTDRPFPDGIACEHNPARFDTTPVPR